MNLLQQFLGFLLNQKSLPSLSTVKNYKADVSQFVNWTEKQSGLAFDPTRVTIQTIEQYKQARNLSKSSIERHTSSLRKFFSFLKTKGYIEIDVFPTTNAKEKVEADPWMLKGFKNFLYEGKKSSLTIKNYISDIKSFFIWLEEVALVKHTWNVSERNLLNQISLSVLEEYKQRLISAKFSPSSVNRKLSSLRNYVGWAKKQGFISPNQDQALSEKTQVIGTQLQTNIEAPQPAPLTNDPSSKDYLYSAFPPKRLLQKSLKGANWIFDTLLTFPIAKSLQHTQDLFWKVTDKNIFRENVSKGFPAPLIPAERISNIRKEFYAPLTISTRYLSTHERVWHYIRHVRPNWYKKYHSYSFTHYVHFALLTVFCCTIGLSIYGKYFVATPEKGIILGTSTNIPPKILSFQGQLTDSNDNPIIKETAILFSLYSEENASSEASIWQETNIVKPNLDGTFSTLLGKQIPITDAIFSQNPNLFLGITVGDRPELQPRQQLATVSLANNSRTLQGMEPITNTTKVSNVVLALDSSGNLTIAGDRSHTFQAIGGNLVLSGKVLSLTTTPGSNSNIEIMPDGIGKIDLTGPIQNSSNNNNLTSSIGSVAFHDTVAILATSSAQSALYINQTSTGKIISAEADGSAKFSLENDGTGIFAGDIEINGGDFISHAKTFNLLNSDVMIVNIGSKTKAINIGASDGTTFIRSGLTIDKDFVLPSFTSNGGILYTNESGKVYQTSAGGSNSDCLVGGSNPSFVSCSTIFNKASTVGIGTTAPVLRLDVWDSQDSTAAAHIYNQSNYPKATGLIVKLGNPLPVSGTSSGAFINFETAGIGTVGTILRNGDGTGVIYETNAADFAEYIKKDKTKTIEYGSLVCLSDGGLATKCDQENNKIIGVASEYPAFLGGKNLGDGSIAVGLIGQIETLVAIQNGEIKAGDILTSSNIPGVAVKSTKAGQVVGKALENLILDESKVIAYYDPDNREFRSKKNFPDIPLKPNVVKIYKIPALVSASWFDPNAYLAQSGELIVQTNNTDSYTIYNPDKGILSNVEGFFEIIAAKIKVGLINASKVVTDTLIVTSDSLIVNGQNLRDYIAQIVKESEALDQKSKLISQTVEATKINTNIISPLSENSHISISFKDSQLKIHNTDNASGSAVATIDNQGNASFTGQLSASSGQFNDASISGILRAKNIVAESIDGLEEKVSSITASTILNSEYLVHTTDFANLASYSAQLSYVPNLTIETAQINQGLMVFGSTSLSDLSVIDTLSIGGTMFLAGNSLEVLGADLSLQSLRQGGLSIMGGLVYIDIDGNIKVQGDLSISGKLAVNIISPLPTSDLTINNASGSSVLSVSQTGDLMASGSGTFAKLNFNLVSQVLAVSPTEVIASSSAGITSIAPYQSEITIKNALVTDKSVVYVTPVGTPSAQTPFLMRQIPHESFTVGVQSPTNHPIDFNWLIVN